ncbi:helix-turn-helix transcriptional regulator [Maritalea porphyrae]|uniref:HTH cro/C1-type domain-containing protein n=1 Tax=Maritalea porphyrae TaxID=880732 RepID=A0ABQ5UQL7_9HYPH|nr:helix-turn-helix transcriptional regulator [Maritalea porphyrae]GLQ16952.1 hypothetical protein GCM10007879_12010 [Maritalea porphyrae]
MRVKVNTIAQARTKKGWTQEHLANVAGISARTVQRAETIGSLSAETAQAICAVLDLDLGEIAETSADTRQEINLPIGLILIAIVLGFGVGLMVGLWAR